MENAYLGEDCTKTISERAIVWQEEEESKGRILDTRVGQIIFSVYLTSLVVHRLLSLYSEYVIQLFGIGIPCAPDFSWHSGIVRTYGQL